MMLSSIPLLVCCVIFLGLLLQSFSFSIPTNSNKE